MADIVYDAFLGSGNNLRQVTQSQYSFNGNPIGGTLSGELDVTEFFGGHAEPKLSFETADLSGLLGIVSVTAGLLLSSDTITLPYNKRANGGTFDGATSHTQLTATDGLLVPTTFSASQDDPAALANVDLIPLSTDGVTFPLAEAIDQSLTAQAFVSQYTMGPASLNGTTVSELVGISVDCGLEVAVKRTDGDLYAQKVYIVRRRPTIDLQFENMDLVNTFASNYTVMTAATAYFRERDGVSYTADVTAQHIKFSFADGIAQVQGIQASGVNEGRPTLRLHGETLTASAASAIT